ncbi:hypothetical protein QNI19_09285 [Cytophagaceae bacterium DM2B3-1]|uniref:Leucine-rich repeat domain-containing protein n=1 Tax=Xanthocytophaga flava TaxID=3048013 RepID=A0ABT7CHA9_9BACT|nr:hypothetical protein [Xanthocytophaga flavus]MDJ1493121.1 hypothetical protein [Xanthocytophaga flavus]
MSETSNEKENVMQLLLSGQLESIELGLEVSNSLQIDIEAFKNDMNTLYDWVEKTRQWGESLSLSEKIVRLLSLTRISHSGQLGFDGFTPLDCIPPQIKYLISLDVLTLSLNHIVELPVEIGFLRNMVILLLSGNHLSFIPAEIGQCQKLEILDLKKQTYSNCLLKLVNVFYLKP